MDSKDKLTKEQIKQLQELTDEILEEAKEVVKDYSENPSELSGSVIQVHENSPYIADREDRLRSSTDGRKLRKRKNILDFSPSTKKKRNKKDVD